jgi:radical SAM superfamily enzyme
MNFQVFKDAVNRLKKRGIRVCAHIINGLPNETREDMMQTVKELNKLRNRWCKNTSITCIE